VDLNVTVNDAVVQRSLDRALTTLGNLTPVFEEFGAWQDGATDDLFESESDPYGDRWAALKDSTLRRKQQRGEFLKTLQATGRMRASTVSKAMKSGYKHGFTDPKARFHDRARKPERKRQLLPDEARGLPKASQQQLEKIIRRRIG